MNASGAPVLADRGWKRAFDDPIVLPDGRELVTLKDAGNYGLRPSEPIGCLHGGSSSGSAALPLAAQSERFSGHRQSAIHP